MGTFTPQYTRYTPHRRFQQCCWRRDLEIRVPEDEGITILRNFSNCLPSYTLQI